MPTIDSKQRLYRFMGLSATIAAFLISIADFILEFSNEHGVSMEILEPVWVDMPQWRFTTSIYLCVFLIPFYILGFWLMYQAIKKSHPKTALVLFVLFSYGVIMGSPMIHTVMSLNPIIYQFGLQNGISENVLADLINHELTNVITPVFIVHYVITWVIAPIILFVTIIRGKAVFKRWTAILNPLVFLIVLMIGQSFLPSVFKYLTPGAINKGNAAMFILFTIHMWRSVAHHDVKSVEGASAA